MIDQHSPFTRVPSDVVDTVDGAETPMPPDAVRQVFRAGHRLSVAVMEKPREYRVTYSLGDIHHLTFLSHEECAAVEADWNAWHWKVNALVPARALMWGMGAAIVWVCAFRTQWMADALANVSISSVPPLWIQALGAVIAVPLIMTLPMFLAAIAASALRDSYMRGYADGVTRGVNRALHITPEVEKEMWDELRDAERTDARWRREQAVQRVTSNREAEE